jgi:hypothetical protein
MAIIVEDGTIVAGANSLASVADGDSYHDGRVSATAWTSADTATKEVALQTATTMLNSMVTWKGGLVDLAQPLSWPRQSVYDNEGRLIATNIVPLAVVSATAELARGLISSDLTQETGDALERIKVDVIELEYSGVGKTSTMIPQYVKFLLSGLVMYFSDVGAMINASPLLRV